MADRFDADRARRIVDRAEERFWAAYDRGDTNAALDALDDAIEEEDAGAPAPAHHSRGTAAYAQALDECFTAATDQVAQEAERRRARSAAARRGWQTRQDRAADRARTRPLGAFGAAGANTPVAVDSVCDEALLHAEDTCPAAVLDLCGGCADGPTRDQVDQALAADRPDAPAQERVRAWLGAAFPAVTGRMITAAAQAHRRYDAALDRFHGRHGVDDAADPAQLWRRVNPVLYAALRVAHLPELPDLGDGPRVHAFTPATPTGAGRHLLGNLTPARYELLQQQGGALAEQDPAAPTDEVPASARRVLAAAHAGGLAWDLTIAEHAVRLVLHGLGSPGTRDTWQWRGGRLDRAHTTGRPLREALAALTTTS